MGKGVVVKDIESLKRFHSNLVQFDNELDRLTKKLNSNLNVLGDDWRDQEYKKFKDELGQAITRFNQYLSKSSEYKTYLNKQYNKLKDF